MCDHGSLGRLHPASYSSFISVRSRRSVDIHLRFFEQRNLPDEIEREKQEHRGRRDSRRIPKHRETPQGMTNSIHELDAHPDPDKERGRRPVLPDGPPKAPEPEGYEDDVEDHEPCLKILRDETAHCTRRWEYFV